MIGGGERVRGVNLTESTDVGRDDEGSDIADRPDEGLDREDCRDELMNR